MRLLPPAAGSTAGRVDSGQYLTDQAYRGPTVLLQIGPHPDVRDLGLDVHNGFEDRVSTAIERWQADGLAYPDLDPVYSANALSYMVDRFLF